MQPRRVHIYYALKHKAADHNGEMDHKQIEYNGIAQLESHFINEILQKLETFGYDKFILLVPALLLITQRISRVGAEIMCASLGTLTLRLHRWWWEYDKRKWQTPTHNQRLFKWNNKTQQMKPDSLTGEITPPNPKDVSKYFLLLNNFYLL